jgi:hypothetical protein
MVRGKDICVAMTAFIGKKKSFGAKVRTHNPKLQLTSQWLWFLSHAYLLWALALAFAYSEYI